MSVEELAIELHESARAAVTSGQTVAAQNHGEKTRTFIEWDDLSEPAREGRRVQAMYLLDRYRITPRGEL